VLAAVLLLGACAPAAETPRVVLIGVDGGSWNLIDPLLEAGELPHLAALRDRGMTAELTAVEPLISPTVWTSLATGRRPEVHGVHSFFADRRTLRVPTVWERFAAAGLRVGLYDYLVTWPPRALPEGFMVPGWLRRDARVEPPDLFERIGLPPYFYEVVDVGGDDEVVANLERELAEKPRYWNRLWDELDLDAGAVVFYAVDVASHRFYHTAFPDQVAVPVEPRWAGVLPRILSGVDRAVGEIVAGLGPEDHVVVVSDHGFTASPDLAPRWAYDPAWLMERAGVEADGFDVINGFLAIGIEVEEGNEDGLARLEEFLAAVRTAGSRPLFEVTVVRPAEDGETAEDLAPWMVDMMASRLPAFAFLFAAGVPEVLDELWPDGTVEIGGERQPLAAFAAPHVFTGVHDPVGIFFAAGPAIRHRPRRDRLSVLDVAPLLTYLAGQPLPDDLEGRPDPTWIEPDHLARHPPRGVAAAEAPRLPPEADVTTGAEDDEDVKRRLRALGYLE
jgi:predicted AlkP superfamily phosphohydrolase/phosphomutase